MSYWLLSRIAHPAEYPNWLRTQVAMMDRVTVDPRLTDGDIIYLYDPQQDAIYGWGYAQKRTRDEIELFDITVAGGKIQNFLTPPGSFKLCKDLAPLLNSLVGATSFIFNKQIRILDGLMVIQGPKPLVPASQQFILNRPADEDEGLKVEYKEVNAGQVPKHAYDYTIAFLRGVGGSIIFGVRNSDKVTVGIKLSYSEKDDLNKTVENKLLSISPQIAPLKDYNLHFHDVIDDSGNKVPDLYVLEVEVKSSGAQIHKTLGGKVYEKTFSGKRRLE